MKSLNVVNEETSVAAVGRYSDVNESTIYIIKKTEANGRQTAAIRFSISAYNS